MEHSPKQAAQEIRCQTNSNPIKDSREESINNPDQ